MRLLFLIMTLIFTLSQIKTSGQSLSEHPRLLVKESEKEEVRGLISKDPLYKSYLRYLINRSRSNFGKPVPEWKPDERSNYLPIAREFLQEIMLQITTFRLTKKVEFLDRAIILLDAACAIDSWNPDHFLDVAEMTTAVAIGYDWLYPHLNPALRERFSASIKQKGLVPYLNGMQKAGSGTEPYWVNFKHNWNLVVSAGAMIGAVAIIEDEPVLARQVYDMAKKKLPESFELYETDGIWFEGTAYQNYANSFAILALETIRSFEGENELNSFLSHYSGFQKSMQSLLMSASPKGRFFNYADSWPESKVIPNHTFTWFANRFNQPELIDFVRPIWGKMLVEDSAKAKYDRLFPLAIMYLPKSYDAKRKYNYTWGSQYFKGPNELLKLQSSISDSDSLYFIAKGGQGSLEHQQLDAGSFIIEAKGELWFEDLGAEKYSLPNFWDKAKGGKRWLYLRNNNRSHNTLVLNDTVQNPEGRAYFSKIDLRSKTPKGTLVLDKVYDLPVKRTFSLEDASTIMIVDSLGKGANKIEWGGVSSANIKIEGDMVTLTKGKKEFYLGFKAKNSFTLETRELKTRFKGESENKGKKRLVLELNNSSEVNTIVCVMGTKKALVLKALNKK